MGEPTGWADVLILALALYGLVIGAVTLVGGVRRILSGKPQAPVGLLVLVRNQEAHIEEFLRVVSELLRVSPRRGIRPDRLVVVDLDSTDETGRILERLSRQDSAIRIVCIPEARLSQAFGLLHGSIAVTVDLREQADSRAILRTLESMW